MCLLTKRINVSHHAEVVCVCLVFRASDDLEKTNTTYIEESQPMQGTCEHHTNTAAQSRVQLTDSLRSVSFVCFTRFKHQPVLFD